MTSELQTKEEGRSEQARRVVTALEKAALMGDLAELTPLERLEYYNGVCRSLGLNPLTKPFLYIRLNGKLTLYATKDATDQLRSLKGVSITSAERDMTDPEFAVWLVTGKDAAGRTDTDIGSVFIGALKGENKSNAIMKALTKAKRRLTLSLAGLGWMNESEVGSIEDAELVPMDSVMPQGSPMPESDPVREAAVAYVSRKPDGPPPPVPPVHAED